MSYNGQNTFIVLLVMVSVHSCQTSSFHDLCSPKKKRTGYPKYKTFTLQACGTKSTGGPTNYVIVVFTQKNKGIGNDKDKIVRCETLRHTILNHNGHALLTDHNDSHALATCWS